MLQMKEFDSKDICKVHTSRHNYPMQYLRVHDFCAVCPLLGSVQSTLPVHLHVLHVLEYCTSTYVLSSMCTSRTFLV